ncbi:MAG: heavy metal translocating P-type ATPase [Clostridia bacterium]|nr:heavy metal translocating P-type ATPase [Clostridia bacterium]
MRKFNVTGMSCAACSARVEKAVEAVEGVELCSVNLLTNSMGVEGKASDQAIIAAVEAAGYGAHAADGSTEKAAKENSSDALENKEIPVLRNRLIASAGFLLLLMYISMGHLMWSWPLPRFLAQNPVAIGILQMLLAAIVMVINQKFFISGFKGLVHRAPNMDTLVALGSMASFVYSVYALFLMADAQACGDLATAAHYLHEFYFESAAMILTLITVGKLLEAISKGRTTNALKSLMDLSPKTATVLRDGKELTVPVEQVKKGELFVVRPGEQIPVDGFVTDGSTAVDESALTGESLPVDKMIGDKVSAGTINRSGFITCEAERVGEDTTLSQIIRIVSDASATKAPIAKAADKVSAIFVPTVLAIAAVTAAVWGIVGEDVGFVLARAISVLVISCPCALGLATPVAIMVGSGVGAKKGILFKTAESLEMAGHAKIAVLDKTGTITMGEPAVTDVVVAEQHTEKELLSFAVSLEKMSEHPLATAIVAHGEKMGAEVFTVNDFEAVPGKGVVGKIDGAVACGGNLAFIGERCPVPERLRSVAEGFAEQGKTPMYFSCGDRLLGVIAVADVIKEDSPEAIREMQSMGFEVIMLTGDNEKTARAIGRAAGVDRVIAGVLPDGKADVVAELKKQGKVIMVGDGINDAPALTVADTGIAIGAGTDVAIDAADVVLMKSKLSDLPAAIKLSRATLRTIRQNLFWAFFYNVIGIPLAAGVWIPVFGWQLNPMFGALAMSLSSFCVVSNALRLNLINITKPVRSKKTNKNPVAVEVTLTEEKGDLMMKKTMKIEGMMCPHCSGRVKKCLEALEQVESAEVSHESGTAVVTLNADVANDVLKKTVEDAGYDVVGIE